MRGVVEQVSEVVVDGGGGLGLEVEVHLVDRDGLHVELARAQEVEELAALDGLHVAHVAGVALGELFLEVFALREEEVADLVEEVCLVGVERLELDWVSGEYLCVS